LIHATQRGRSSSDVERHHGALIDGAHAGITSRLDALEARQRKAEDDAAER
jgi:hypothetical protein